MIATSVAQMDPVKKSSAIMKTKLLFKCNGQLNKLFQVLLKKIKILNAFRIPCKRYVEKHKNSGSIYVDDAHQKQARDFYYLSKIII